MGTSSLLSAAVGRYGPRHFVEWLFTPMPLARVAVLRVLVFAFVIVDVVYLHTSGWYHGYADPVWYQALDIGRILHLPAATVPMVELLKWGCVATALVAMTGRAPRLTGWLVAAAWCWYQYVAFAYGKVDHDRGDFVVALLLLPTVGIAYLNDERRSQAAGFALRAIQISAISTYFLSSVAKIRFGGWGWVNSATLVRAVVRRGTPIGHWFLHVPWFLHTFQWVIVIAELSSPIIFFTNERWRRRLVGAWYLFHVSVYATITIAFWPHLVMMLAFLPLEEYAAGLRRRWRRGRPPDEPPLDPDLVGSAAWGTSAH
jgi:hypothetical protein